MRAPSGPIDERMAEYIRANRDAYTREAIRAALLSAGQDEAAVDAALAATLDGPGSPPATVPGPSAGSDRFGKRARAAAIVVVAYVATWVVFALLPAWNQSGPFSGPFLLQILAIALAVSGVASILILAVHPALRADASKGIAAALVVPFVLLVIVAGICVPFVPR